MPGALLASVLLAGGCSALFDQAQGNNDAGTSSDASVGGRDGGGDSRDGGQTNPDFCNADHGFDDPAELQFPITQTSPDGACAIDSAEKVCGVGSLACTLDGSGSGGSDSLATVTIPFAAGRQRLFRFYVNIATGTLGQVAVAQIRTANGPLGEVIYDGATRALGLYSVPDNLTINGSSYDVGQWALLQVLVNLQPSPGTLSLQVDGKPGVQLQSSMSGVDIEAIAVGIPFQDSPADASIVRIDALNIEGPGI